MRLIFKKGFQKKLIEDIKESSRLTWNELGTFANIPSGYLKSDLRYEKRALSLDYYHNLSKLSSQDYSQFIIKKLDDNWGRSKGGKISKPSPNPIITLVDKPSIKLAELVGIMLGDGNIWVNKKKNGYYYTRISGHSINDKKYLLGYVKPLIYDLFKIKMETYYSKESKCMHLTKANKNLAYNLNRFGICFGNKLKNNIEIPGWVFSSKDFLKACIRGLIDTDGSVCSITGRDYTYIWFKSAIPNLRISFSKAMSLLGYKTSGWSKIGTPQVYIGQKNLIRKYYKEIGFNNPKHLDRLKLPL